MRISFYSLLASLVVLFAPQSWAQTNEATNAAPAADQPIRVSCLGDSITMGVGTPTPATQSYPAQLQEILGPKYVVTNLGVGGRTLLRKADPYSIGKALKSEPDIVIILLGTNDSRQATWDKFGNDFVGDYEKIIDQLAALPTRPKIFICTTTPAFPGRYGISEDVITTDTIPAIQQVAKDKNVPLIDLHAPMLDQKANFGDTVHPNPAAAHRIAELVAAAITGSGPPQ
jgi:lysophospholipase L1-like esterase